MSFFNFLSQKHTRVNFQDHKLFETEIIRECQLLKIFKMSAEARQFDILKKYHKF